MPLSPNTTSRPRRAYCGCNVEAGGFVCQNCVNCRTHCQCTECGRCGRPAYSDEFCDTCTRCTNCCQCMRCGRCGLRSPTLSQFCQEGCGYCTACCRCYFCTVCNTQATTAAQRREFHVDCSRCAEHCNCYICHNPECRKRTNRAGNCQSCANCLAHCSCVDCPICRRRVSRSTLCIEDDCGGCQRCCGCRALGVPFREGCFQWFTANFGKGEFKQNPLRRHLAVEMEVDRFSGTLSAKAINKALNYWRDSVVRDGSITGFEINTNPSNGDVFLRHIRELTDGLAKIKGGCTTACGLHVHVNVKGSPLYGRDGKMLLGKDGEQLFDPRDAYTHYDLRRLILIYAMVEPALFELCEPARLNGHYSQICGMYYLTKNINPAEFRKDIVSKMYRNGSKLPKAVKGRGVNRELVAIAKDITHKKSEKYMSIRYKALNLHSFFLRGTIEFRHKEGTVDYNEITNWALVCGTLVDKAAKITDKDIRALPRQPRETMKALLPDNLRQWAERKWEARNALIPRYDQYIKENWNNRTVAIDDYLSNQPISNQPI